MLQQYKLFPIDLHLVRSPKMKAFLESMRDEVPRIVHYIWCANILVLINNSYKCPKTDTVLSSALGRTASSIVCSLSKATSVQGRVCIFILILGLWLGLWLICVGEHFF